MNLKATRDGQYLMATGVYKPQIRVWDLDQMAMKFERHVDCENVAFEILSEDWTKSVHLQTDRTVEFHSHYGMHYQTRIPKFGRDLAYHYPSCDLLVCGASSEVWRLNLEQGRFMTALETQLPEINKIAINPAHQLFGFGGSNGKVEFWHPTQRKCIGVLDVAESLVKTIDSSLLDSLPEITALEFARDGLSFCAGTSTGQVVLYDLRNPMPLLIKDHQYGYPINSLAFHSSGKVISSDTKIVKMWDKDDGKIFTNIESPADINDTCVFGDSGLVMLANEGSLIQSYYVPALGTAPKWCSFLDNLTEELEENPNTTVYDDYKFVTKKELTNLGLDHLVGTGVLKAYMHGFFIDLRLYEKAKAIANPFQFDEYKKKMVQKKLEEKRASRISAHKKLPKVNTELAAEFLSEDDSEAESGDEQKKKSKKKKDGINLLQDDRFKSMFSDAEFQVDTSTYEYKLHHPSESQTKATARKFEPVQELEHSDEDDDQIRFSRFKKEKTRSGPQFYELKDGLQATTRPTDVFEKEALQGRDFASRLNHSEAAKDAAKALRTGNLSVSFNPSQERGGKRDKFAPSRSKPGKRKPSGPGHRSKK
ncbi:hypothetical protein HDV03_000211 [Kappamyces sp. JEL0829]|nr:hypothetical protein HDV03_000211 [Kappamyces sp. JEL0829]